MNLNTHILSLSLSSAGGSGFPARRQRACASRDSLRAALANVSLLLALVAGGSASAQVVIKDTVVISPEPAPASPQSQLIWETPEWGRLRIWVCSYQSPFFCSVGIRRVVLDYPVDSTLACELCGNLAYGSRWAPSRGWPEGTPVSMHVRWDSTTLIYPDSLSGTGTQRQFWFSLPNPPRRGYITAELWPGPTCDTPRVQITHPAQDTTIILTPSNQPVIVFRETHTPAVGDCEPIISWEPDDTLRTSGYWGQIVDSIQIPVIVTARNQYTARDTVVVTLVKEELVLTVSPTQIRPRGTGGVDTAAVTVRARRGGQLAGIPIHLDARAVDSSGGHAHTAGRPAGVFGDSDGITDTNGVYRTTFYANWFGGQEWIIASSSQIAQRDSVLMTLRVPGLELLPAGRHYVKIGGTCSHHGPRDDNQHQGCRTPDNNHYAAQLVRDSLPLMAAFWVDSLEQDTLFINDISLPFGGIFDIYGIWAPPHTTHRSGLEVDIRTELLSENPPRRGIKVRNAEGKTVGNEDFESLAKSFGVRLPNIDERGTNFEHYHLYYRSP